MSEPTPTNLSGLPPQSVPLLSLPDTFPKVSCGLYIATGATASGKSVTAAAFARSCARAGVNSGYLYAFEARQTLGAFQRRVEGDVVVSVSPGEFAYLIPKLTAAEWKVYDLDRWYNGLGNPSILVIDSMTLPMRAYAADVVKGRAGEPTMSQGMQPSDIAFCERMQAWAVERKLVIIGVVNYDLVPFADKLEGIVEGIFKVRRPGVFDIRNRVTRQSTEVTLPQEDLDYALRDFFKYASTAQAADVPEYTPMGYPVIKNPTPPDYQFGVRNDQI